jgi:hypothetical protein
MDLRAQIEGIVVKIAGAVEELAHTLGARAGLGGPRRVGAPLSGPGQAVAHELPTLLWPRYGTGIRARRCGARVAAPDVAAAAAPGRCAIS